MTLNQTYPPPDWGVLGDGDHDDAPGIQRLIDRYGVEILMALPRGKPLKLGKPVRVHRG